MKKVTKWIFLISLLISLIYISYLFITSNKAEEIINIAGLKSKVTIIRDEKGMAYIYAQDISDALAAQGYITAKDRLLQMELTRLYAQGRISELIGKNGKETDVKMRTIGFYRNAKKHAQILDSKTKAFFNSYLNGVNAYIKTQTNDFPLELKLSGLKPAVWTISDSLSILYAMSWNSAANLTTEIIAQMLVEKLGLEKAKEIFPINRDMSGLIEEDLTSLNLFNDKKLLSYLEDNKLKIGSNNWAIDQNMSNSGKPILANDPHLDSRFLPGPWYPIGFITPEFRAVGAVISGIPGITIGRNNNIAIGITNSYGDAQDVYIETVDPKNSNRYLEGEQSIPFEIIEEIISIRDKKAKNDFYKEKIKIKLTKRGPVISDLLPSLKSLKVMTARWAPFETMEPSIGIDQIFRAKSAYEIKEALKQVNQIMLNFVFADKEGNIGWYASGKLPIRSNKASVLPYVVTNDKDNWIGWIPKDNMPQRFNPKQGWIGTCNNKTVNDNYQYYYSSYFAPYYRYSRLEQLMKTQGKKSVDDSFMFQKDTMNIMASKIAPIIVKSLIYHENTKKISNILSSWDYHDDASKAAPAIFHAIYRKFAFLVFENKLGKELAKTILSSNYFWQERLEKMIIDGNSLWFDRDKLFYTAALEVIKDFSSQFGTNPDTWLWGNIHKIEFVNPIRRKGIGKKLFGSVKYSVSGSGETLYRNSYDLNEPFDVAYSTSLMMVVDLADDEKVLAVIPGGVSGRFLNSHYKDQIKPFMEGEKLYWWFSDKSINEHCESKISLIP